MIKMLSKMCNRLSGNWWVVVKSGWPYPEGYATYNRAKRTLLDTGLTKAQAQSICDSMNNGAQNAYHS